MFTASSFRRRSRGLVATGALIALGCTLITPLAATADDVDPIDGAATAGDTLFPGVGNGGYDVTHYDIDLTYVDNMTPVVATTVIDATVTGAPLSSFSFDYEGPELTEVLLDGEPVDYEAVNTGTAADPFAKLFIVPETPVTGDFEVAVSYAGTPTEHIDADDSSEGWIQTADGATALGQPIGSMGWFPNNNTPADKATFSIDVTVPSAKKAASNGELVGTVEDAEAGTTTWQWRQDRPMATELSVLSIGNFDMTTDSITLASGTVLPVWTFVDSSISTNTKTTIATRLTQIKPILDWLETKLGPYPGSSTGAIVDRAGVGYALETQDRPFFDGSVSANTLVHELVHQWLGNDVAPSTWEHIWLNEGGAEFFTAYYNYSVGLTATHPATNAYNRWNSAGAGNWTTPSVGFTDPADLYGYQAYNRSNYTLGALMEVLGQETFDEFARAWVDTYAGGHADTDDFIALAEEISGKDLGAFFQDWLYDTDKPAWPALSTAALTASIEADAELTGGDPLALSVTTTNTGRVALSNAQITLASATLLDEVELPEELPEFVSLVDGALVWSVPSLPAATAGSDPLSASVEIPLTIAAASSGADVSIELASSDPGLTVTSEPITFTTTKLPVSPAGTPTLSTAAPKVGVQMRAAAGEWAEGTTLSYQWFAGGKAIAGKTKAWFTPSAAEVGKPISVTVTGTLDRHESVSTTSVATKAVARATIVVRTRPAITGTAKVGKILKVTPTSWGTGVKATYQWKVDGKVVSTWTKLTLKSAWAGKKVSVTVTLSKSGYVTRTLVSNPSATIKKR